jgi:hypothetical protein
MARTRLVQIVNRTTGPLDCMFDGVPEVIPAGYKRALVPKLNANGDAIVKDGQAVMVEEIVGAGRDGEPLEHTVEFSAAEAYIRQHPIMGTADPASVDARDTDYLLGVEAWGHDIDHQEQSNSRELIDRSLLPDDRQNIKFVNVRGKRRDVSPGAITSRKIKENKRRAALVDPRLTNPNGIRVSGA